MTRAHSTESLAVGVKVNKVDDGWSPLVAFANVFTEGWGCDGFGDGSLVLCVDGTSLDMKLGSVSGDARDNRAVAFEEALIVDSFTVCVAVELGFER